MRLRFLRIITVITLCLCLYSCAWEGENISTNMDQTENTLTSSSESESGLVTDGINVNGGKLLDFTSLSKYEEYVTSNELPKNFVRYDSISQIGEFAFFVCTTFYSHGNYSYYDYLLIDDNNYVICVKIVENYAPEVEYTAVTFVDAEDMRTIDEIGRCVYTYSDIRYCYEEGNLCSVEWDIDTITYMISIEFRFDDRNIGPESYPLDGEPTVVSKFLRLETAVEAAQMISPFTVEQ